MKKTAMLMHDELLDLIQTLSDVSTDSDWSSVCTWFTIHALNSVQARFIWVQMIQKTGIGPSLRMNPFSHFLESSTSFSMLPSKPKILHGRESEVENIMKMLSQASPRIAILGGGGMGKTSLAKAVLHHTDTSDKFQCRFFVSAESATTSIELAALIGLHIGLNPGKDLTRPVVQYFSQKPPSLLILDNLETVWEPIQSRGGIEEFLSLLTEVEHLALMVCLA
jgi:hypothetical protein